jgi:hypothetical protein
MRTAVITASVPVLRNLHHDGRVQRQCAEFLTGLHRLYQSGVVVTQQQGAIGTEGVDIIVAIHVGHAAAEGRFGIQRVWGEITEITGHTTSKDRPGLLVKLRRTRRLAQVIADDPIADGFVLVPVFDGGAVRGHHL